MKEVDATTARRDLRPILDRVLVTGEPTCITRYGEPIALVVPVPASYFEERYAAVEDGSGERRGGSEEAAPRCYPPENQTPGATR